ncbi:MAG: ADP-ribosylation factor-like protein [Candidatus Lokiarchaeota archaeon]
MVILKSGNIYLKLVYYGPANSGKTTILDTLFRLTQKEIKDILPVENLTKISRTSGSTLYFDRGLFQSTKQERVFYNVYAVAGQKSFSPLRERVLRGADGLIFVADSQLKFLSENIDSLKELIEKSENKLISEIPLIIMLNKQDLENVIKKEDFKKILVKHRLFFESGPLSKWNPQIIESCGLIQKHRNIYESFHECARRSVLYQTYGNGKAPLEKIPLTIPSQEINGV